MTDAQAARAGSWRLGDRSVNRIGFGAMRLTGSAAFGAGPPRDRGQAIRVLRRAIELGVDHIDTAAFYFSADRSANQLISRALSPYADDLTIVTKVGPGRDPSGHWVWATPEQLRGQVEENLRQLGRDHLDVVNLRTRGRGPIGAHMEALVELRQAGLIRHLGVSNVDLAQAQEAAAIADVVCVQNRFGLDTRTADDDAVLLWCAERGTAFVPFFAIAGAGREAGTLREEPEALLTVAREHDATPAQVRLAWTLHLGPHVLAIPGTGDPAHLEQNVAAGALRLSPDDLARLDAVAGQNAPDQSPRD